ncbi:MAG: hypothetical protein ACRDFC_03915, partial [Ignavibacteria bacterium]
MQRKTIILFALCYLLFDICYSQPSITWQRTYDGPDSLWDAAYDVCLSTNGNFFVVGYTTT